MRHKHLPEFLATSTERAEVAIGSCARTDCGWSVGTAQPLTTAGCRRIEAEQRACIWMAGYAQWASSTPHVEQRLSRHTICRHVDACRHGSRGCGVAQSGWQHPVHCRFHAHCCPAHEEQPLWWRSLGFLAVRAPVACVLRACGASAWLRVPCSAIAIVTCGSRVYRPFERLSRVTHMVHVREFLGLESAPKASFRPFTYRKQIIYTSEVFIELL
jgi:hypothetical protein